MKLLKHLSFILLLITLVACGGSGESLTREGNGDTTPTEEIITLTLVISNINVTEQNPATVTATLTKDGVAMSGEVVTFSTSLGVFDPEIGTALTDANGNASIILNAGEISGAGVVRGAIDSGEDNTIGFTTEAVSDVVVRIGNDTGGSFTEGQLNVSLAQISAGGTTVILANIVDEQGGLYTEPVEIAFTSRCTEEATPSATLSTPVTTSNGTATSTYLAKGCVGDDVITANAIVGSTNLSATGSVNILAADAGSIIFESATPEHIAILGTGGDESSTVVFRVLDVNGNPINDQEVAFELSTEVGGIVLSPLTATTNANGEVQTVVNSGTVSTSIRVKATIVGSDPAISSQSKLLVLSTGIPDQDSFTLSATIVNPEGWDVDGTEVAITARLADAFNNPAPDDTAVSFTTEGGSIDSFCVTVNGACTVTWRSQLPRPEGKELQDEGATPETFNTMGQKFGGRATILATAIGEESFPDSNGNGRFDASEMTAFSGTDISGQPYDLKEAFVDHNEDGFYNPGETDAAEETGGDLEEFSDFNNDSTFTINDGLYNGVLCSEPAHAGCSVTQQSINVRATLVLVMSGSAPEVLSLTPDITLVGESSDIITIVIADLHNQPMPAGTTVIFSTTVGSLSSASSFTWPNDNHNGGRQYSVAIKGETDPTSGVVFVEIQTPSGVVSSLQVASVTIL